MKFCVPIIYRGQANFLVEANNLAEAEDKARLKFREGQPADVLGNEWEEVERVGLIEKI